MPDQSRKQKENSGTPFFVDDTCISCGACWKEAPTVFRSHELHTYAYVYHQPENEAELEHCLKAMEICPVTAIGKLEK